MHLLIERQDGAAPHGYTTNVYVEKREKEGERESDRKK